MGKRTVITRARRPDRSLKDDFPFTYEMLPILSSQSIGAKTLNSYREQAWELYTKFPMPTTQDEAWRRTDLKGLNAGSFELPNDHNRTNFPLLPKELIQPLVGNQHGGQLTIQPERIDLHVDPSIVQKGVIFTDLSTATTEYPDLLSKIIGKVVLAEEGRFAALAAALSQSGVLIYVPSGVQVEEPLHSVIWGPGSGLAYMTHVIVWLEEGSSLTYVHESASPKDSEGQTLHVGMVELQVCEGANLRFVELQSWGNNVWNFSHERARVGRDGKVDWIFGALGSQVTKNFSTIDLESDGASGRMSGFYFTDGNQHLDHDTQQNHLAPNTTSDLLFKGALKDRSHSVWQGMIYVAPGAQKSDGYQANRNLILSSNSRADSIPGLEILADDVRCTHGATVGKIDPDPIFYLRSRGIPYGEAEKLIVEGYFDPIMQRIPFEGVRERFQQEIINKLQ